MCRMESFINAAKENAEKSVDPYSRDENNQQAENHVEDNVVRDENTAPQNNPAPTEYGTLTPQHLENMRAFWNSIQSLPSVDLYPANTAYVLPRDYGFGFRRSDDKIWGIWEADLLSPKILSDINQLIQIHGLDLDIVYETEIENQPIDLPYDRLIFWNGTIIQK